MHRTEQAPQPDAASPKQDFKEQGMLILFSLIFYLQTGKWDQISKMSFELVNYMMYIYTNLPKNKIKNPLKHYLCFNRHLSALSESYYY